MSVLNSSDWLNNANCERVQPEPIPPSWFNYFNPVHQITADCVLEWPDARNCNEFPVICPVHGIWSRWCIKPNELICTCDKDRTDPNSAKDSRKNEPDEPIEKILRRIWDGELPSILNGLNTGGAADSLENRRRAFMGQQLGWTPRGPVITDSHSVRAFSGRRKPHLDIWALPLYCVYAYLKDLKYCVEWCALFRSQIRHVVPDDLNLKTCYKEITVYRKRDCTGLCVNIFPNIKCFVTSIDYDQFIVRPDLSYGDQILELGHCVLQQSNINLSRSATENDVFRLRIRPCPFLKTLCLIIGPCPIVEEANISKRKKDVLRSYRDLGFSIYQGCVTAVACDSPAQKAGLKPDHRIVEVDGRFVLKHADSQIISLIRNAITKNPTRSVKLVVIPQRFYEHLKSVNNVHHVSTNRGFNLKSWIGAEAFGFCKSMKYL